MSWIDQCKTAFYVTAKVRAAMKGTSKRQVGRTIAEMAAESGVPVATLTRWWYETHYEKLVPICVECNEAGVIVRPNTQNPVSPRSPSYGLCETCTKKNRVAASATKGGKNGQRKHARRFEGKDGGEEFYSFEAPEQRLRNVNMLNQAKI